MNDKQNQMILAYLAAIEETLRQQSAAHILLTEAVVKLVERLDAIADQDR
jgi:hypothetical protein